MTVEAVPDGARGTRLGECACPLSDRYDVAMLDLDGVVYVGPDAVPGAAQHLERARAAGMQLGFVTNNAARPPATVAAHLTELGIAAGAADVVTSAQAAARLVASEVGEGAPVYVIGGEGLFEALVEQHLRPVQSIDEEPEAVVSGYFPDLRWRTVIDGALLVRRGLPWVASNTDRTVPTPHGPGPGNGVLVGVVADFAGRSPVVAGKPEPPLFQETVLRIGGRSPLVVGDRLDTDIEGAVNAGYDSLLVMTGVTGLAELVAAPPGCRPTYVAASLAALVERQPLPKGGPQWRQDDWRAEVADGALAVTGDGGIDSWWRVVASAAWAWRDDVGEVPDIVGLAVPGG
jgi:glycerol 3-phosphatase-2